MMWHDIEQNTETWLDLRQGKITCSQFGVIMANYGKAFGEPARKYALKLALEKITGKRSEFGFSNFHTQRGHEQEPIARALYEIENYVDVTNGGFFDHGTFGASPDGLIGTDGIVEIKSVVPETHYATLRRGKPDPAYQWQYVGHLECSDRLWIDCVSFCSDFPEGKKIITHRRYREDYEEEMDMLSERRDDFAVLINDIHQEITGA